MLRTPPATRLQQVLVRVANDRAYRAHVIAERDVAQVEARLPEQAWQQVLAVVTVLTAEEDAEASQADDRPPDPDAAIGRRPATPSRMQVEGPWRRA